MSMATRVSGTMWYISPKVVLDHGGVGGLRDCPAHAHRAPASRKEERHLEHRRAAVDHRHPFCRADDAGGGSPVMQRLLMVGMNHATAPCAVREKCAFTPEQREAALARFHERFPEAEAVLVSTCNRVELYVARPVHGHPASEEIVQFIAEFHGISEAELRPHLYDRGRREVADHLFAVTASLDSLVVGETQILSQVREAYEVSNKLGLAGNLLHPLFQRAIAAAREAVTQTRLAEGRRSVASIAVDYARQIFENFADKTVLNIGAGKMSTLVLKHFSELRIKRLVVLNRDITKAQALGQQFGGAAASMDDLLQHLSEADIVVTGTASPDADHHGRAVPSGDEEAPLASGIPD